MLYTDVTYMFSLFLRVAFRFILEGGFCYCLFATRSVRSKNTDSRCSLRGRRDVVFFLFLYSTALILPVVLLRDDAFYRLVSVAVVFLYFYHKCWLKRKSVATCFRIRQCGYILTAAIFLALTTEFILSVSHILIHGLCMLFNVYDAIRNHFVSYEIYKYVIMLVHVCLLFLVYKLRILKMSDVKAISINRWVPVSFGLCLLSIVYVKYNYSAFGAIPAVAPYRDAFLWVLAFLLPTYLGFYLTISKLTKLLSIKLNCAADDNIFVWIFNPSMIETIHLSIYDSELFMPSFEANRLAFKKKLEKLGIDNGYKGYSEMVFCLILTKLFMGMKGWSFERDIFGQASLVIDTPFPEVRKNIEAIIEKVWLTDDSETLIDGYYLPCCNNDMYDGRERPSAEEFLMQMAKSV